MPKLTSILSGTVGTSDQARTSRLADPTHSPDFSQLLGERRSQAAVTYAKNHSAGASPTTPARNDQQPEAANRDTQQPSSAPVAATSVTENPDTKSQAARVDAPKASEIEDPDTQESHASSQPSMGGSDTPLPATAGSINTASVTGGEIIAQTGGSHDPLTSGPLLQPDSNLELLAAEPGLPPLAVPTSPILTRAETLTASANSASIAIPPVDTMSRAALPLAQAVDVAVTVSPASSEDGNALLATKLPAASVPAPETSIAGHIAATPSIASGNAVASLIATGAPVTQPATATPQPTDLIVSSSALVSAAAMAARPETTIRGVAAPALAVETATTVAQTPVSSPVTALPPTEETFRSAPVVVASPTDTDTAAGRSLQEFTAMVEAARATSGTSLPPPVSIVEPGIAALTPDSLATAGVLAGQPLVGTGPSAVLRMAAPLNSPRWPVEFGRQVIHIAQNHSGLGQVAELRLDPPELGPLRITINLTDNVAHAVFSSPHAAVRQTVESSLPQLQQMLEQAGISLGQANVNDQRQSEHAFQGRTGQSKPQAGNSGAASGPSAGAQEEGTHSNRPSNPNALVDTFA